MDSINLHSIESLNNNLDVIILWDVCIWGKFFYFEVYNSILHLAKCNRNREGFALKCNFLTVQNIKYIFPYEDSLLSDFKITLKNNNKDNLQLIQR